MNIRDKLKELGIKPVDISKVTGLSRVWVYEYLKRYDENNTYNLKKEVVDLIKNIDNSKDYYEAMEYIIKYNKKKHY